MPIPDGGDFDLGLFIALAIGVATIVYFIFY